MLYIPSSHLLKTSFSKSQFVIMAAVGFDENISNITSHHECAPFLPHACICLTDTFSAYPGIDRKVHYDAQTYKGKVVFITGASRGIGEETALSYARAGALLSLVARKQTTLDSVKATILKEVPGAKVLTFPMDVTHTQEVARAIQATVDQFGKLDILIANAGVLRPMEKRTFAWLFSLKFSLTFAIAFAQQDPDGWWHVMEVNIRGVYNAVQ